VLGANGQQTVVSVSFKSLFTSLEADWRPPTLDETLAACEGPLVLRPPRSAKGRRHAPAPHDLGMQYAVQISCERKCFPPPTPPPPPAVPTRARGRRRFDRGAKGGAGGALESLVRATSSAVGVAQLPLSTSPYASPYCTSAGARRTAPPGSGGSAPGPHAPNDPRGARLRRRAR